MYAGAQIQFVLHLFFQVSFAYMAMLSMRLYLTD